MADATRRSLLTGLGALICAPAIVRASSLMPVKAYLDELSFVPLYGWSGSPDYPVVSPHPLVDRFRDDYRRVMGAEPRIFVITRYGQSGGYL
jgi:hypothetical protein